MNFGEDQAEHCETSWEAADLNRALVQAHDRANNCQAQPRPTFCTRAAGIDAVKAFEQMRNVLRRNANSRITDG